MKQSAVDLNSLVILADVVAAGGFAAAGRRRDVPGNRLSRQVQRLEARLGVRLLLRTTRRLNLTAAGRRLLDAARPALRDLEAAWREASAQSEMPQGHLRVAGPADLMAVLTPAQIAKFLKRHPRVSLELLLSDDPVDLVGGGVDFAIRAGPITDDNLIARRLLASRLVVVASPACIKAHGRPEHPEALGGYPCLASRSHEGRAVWWLARTARGAGPGAVGAGAAAVRVAVKARLTVNGMGALIASAEAGLGAALVPEQMVRSGLAAGRLVRLVTGYCQDGGGVFAVYARGQQTSAALRAFVEFLVAAAATAAR